MHNYFIAKTEQRIDKNAYPNLSQKIKMRLDARMNFQKQPKSEKYRNHSPTLP